MTAIERHVRGAMIGFSSSFIDETGAAYTPDSATLKIVYMANGVKTTVSKSMTIAAGIGKASWDSSVADANLVYWFVTAGASSKPADQGSILLVANLANPGT